MKIFIPSLGRSHRQITYEYLPDKWKEKTTFVVPYGEDIDMPNVIQTDESIKGIAATRQFIIDIAEDSVFMMDDDLHFHHRENGKLCKSGPEQVGNALDLMQLWIKEIPCVGFSSRFGNNWIAEDYVECHRPCMAYGLNPFVLKENKIKFDKFEVCEDYHVFLSLLRLGYKNRMTAQYTVTSPSVNKDGGCSEYRTREMVEKAMEAFVEHHSPYATFRNTKSDTQGFEIGKELRIKWRKAYEDAVALKKVYGTAHA
jgi:hypothetical protein